MNRLNAFYDRYAERWDFSLRSAIAYTALYAFMIYIGIRGILSPRYPFYIYIAPFTLLVGVVGILHVVHVIRAVRRQKNSETSN